MNSSDIDDFRSEILELKPAHFMALGGASAGIVGGADSGSTVMAQLQRSVIEFTRLYKSGPDKAALRQARRDVTSKIMVAVTVGALNEQRADELMDKLGKLMKRKD